jgi:WD40 repeat protein
MGDGSDNVGFVAMLKSLVAEDESQISLFLQDAWRFVLAFNSTVIQPPLQVYASARHFRRLKSIVRSVFSDQALATVRVTQGIPDRWIACLLTCEGYSGRVYGVVFSPDGKQVASGSYDQTARVWKHRQASVNTRLKIS